MRLSHYVLAIVLLSILALSCGGGGGRLEVGSIQGPDSIPENSSAEFIVPASGDSDIAYQWSVDPPSAGTFSNATSATATFNSHSVKTLIRVRIIVTVASANYGPELRMRDCEIRAIGELVVKEIEGSSSVDEDRVGHFSIEAYGDPGIKYQWSIDPPDVGCLTHPISRETYFIPTFIGSTLTATISATVTSDNFGPVTKSADFQLNDILFLQPSEIGGPPQLDEKTIVAFSISAVGDDGIGFQWSCDPSSAGIFTDPASSSTSFEVAPVTENSPAVISATVGCRHYASQSKQLELLVRDLPVYDWAQTWGGAEGSVWTSGIVTDDNGAVYVCGDFAGTVDFDPGPDAYEMVSAGSRDAFLAKFDSSGNLLWARAIGGDYDDQCYDLAIDVAGNVYLTGSFLYDCDFDPGPGEDIRSPVGYVDCYVAKFDPSGNRDWACTWGSWDADVGLGIAVDGLGGVYVTGYFTGTVDFDPGPGVDEHTPFDPDHYYESDCFLSRFDSSGNFCWANTWGGPREDISYAVAAGVSGDVFVVGSFQYSCGFDPDGSPTKADLHESNGGYDAFLSAFSSAGEFKWASTWGSDTSDGAYSLDVGDSGMICVVGTFLYTADLDPGPGVDLHEASSGSYDVYLSAFDPSGAYRWGRSWGPPVLYFPEAFAIDLDSHGNIYLASNFSYPMDFDPGPAECIYSPFKQITGYPDACLSKFDSQGNFVWARTWGGPDMDWATAVAADSSGNIYLTGVFEETVDFDPTFEVDEHSTGGDYDGAFLLKLLPEGGW